MARKTSIAGVFCTSRSWGTWSRLPSTGSARRWCCDSERTARSRRPRGSALAPDGYVRSVAALKDLFFTCAVGNHAQLMDRLCRTARGMLNTFTREQGVEKADHIAVQILDARTRGSCAPVAHLAKFLSSEGPAGDERLRGALALSSRGCGRPNWRCCPSAASRPCRVMLCREHLQCVSEALDRAAAPGG